MMKRHEMLRRGLERHKMQRHGMTRRKMQRHRMERQEMERRKEARLDEEPTFLDEGEQELEELLLSDGNNDLIGISAYIPAAAAPMGTRQYCSTVEAGVNASIPVCSLI